MKPLLLLLCALLIFSLPAPAQDAAAPQDATPQDVAWNFNFQYLQKTRVTAATLGYAVAVPGAPDGKVAFDETVTGKNGIIERETLAFIDEKGAILGKLTSTFDQDGHLESQALTEGKAPARPLDWPSKGDESPVLTVKGSTLTARYVLQSGRLKARVLNARFPAGTREIKTDYDERGRRESDTSLLYKGTDAVGATDYHYFYDESGLTNVRGTAGPEDKPLEATITRAPDGKSARLSAKSDGILSYRTTFFIGEKGEKQGMKMENFEGGIRTSVVTIVNDAKTMVMESYKAGVLSTRTTRSVGKGVILLVSQEEFDAQGKLTQRTDYNSKGAASTVTTFGADGAAKETHDAG